MKQNIKKNILHAFYVALSILALAALAGSSAAVNAQTNRPNILLSWNAQTYTPPGYPGRALPSAESNISLGVDVMVNGKSVNLSPYTVTWEYNGNRVASQKGLDQTSVTAANILGTRSTSAKVTIENFQGQTLAKTIQIPVTPPRVAIQPQSKAENTYTFRGVPYFFNVQNLSSIVFNWQVNGQTPSSERLPQILQVTLDSSTPLGADVSVSLRASNTANNQSASAITQFTHR